MVLLNTFPISIMNHLLLIIPVQPRGLAFIQRNGLCIRVCACAQMSMHARVCSRAQHLPKAPNEGIDTAHVTDREQVV